MGRGGVSVNCTRLRRWVIGASSGTVVTKDFRPRAGAAIGQPTIA
jgi:hypothetical protein